MVKEGKFVSMSRVHVISLTLIVLPLIAPLIFYIWTFGGRLSSEHSRWGEFGSAMSGIYTPILTLLTISILVFQARLQKQMHDYIQSNHGIYWSSLNGYWILRNSTWISLFAENFYRKHGPRNLTLSISANKHWSTWFTDAEKNRSWIELRDTVAFGSLPCASGCACRFIYISRDAVPVELQLGNSEANSLVIFWNMCCVGELQSHSNWGPYQREVRI